MKRDSSKFIGWQGVILAILVALCGLLEPAYCKTNDPVLLLQQTPPQGGIITPDVGVHYFDLYTDVTLVAVPKLGYQFVYWIGDVSDPTANRTIVYLDAPKIVIAVFERAEYEFRAVEAKTQSGSIGGLFAGAADYSRTGYTGGGRKRPRKWGWAPEEEEPEEMEEDLPVPLPEPVTVCMLGLGGLILLRRRRTGQC
jgi:hypothetical protein